MKKFIIIEIGSTTTKAYLYEEEEIKQIGNIVIEFKKNYKINKEITKEDKETLFTFVNDLKSDNTFVYGTSIFRNLDDKQKDAWLQEFKERTGLDFEIVTPDMENEYTVYGAVHEAGYKGKVAVMIGGGGSTELSIVENEKIIEKANNDFGAVDVSDKFPDLMEDKATSDFDEMVRETKSWLNVPKNKADILILAGGNYIYFYETLGYDIAKNEFSTSHLQPYSVDKKTMDELDQDFFYNRSLNEVIELTNDPGWWKGARGMRICVKALADTLDAKYIIPTKISMVYGIANKLKDSSF